MTTLNTGVSEESERQAMLKSMPILQPQDIAEAIGYVLSTPENVQIQELTIVPLGETF
jgi:NADP+-dependent farnesol dehydrogenase